MRTRPNVLVLCSDGITSVSLEATLREHAQLTRALDLTELQDLLENYCFDAVFSAWTFHLGTWRIALREVQRLQPDLPVIIFGSAGSEQGWAQVLDAGGFDLLVPPYRDANVVAALEQAIASYDARLLRRMAAL